MDPGTIATISGLATATKATVDTVRVILERAKGRDAEKAAKEALGLVAELNTRLLQLQEIAFRLHQEKAQALEENAKLRAEIRAEKEGAADRKKYYLKKVGKSDVLACDETPETFYCPTCFKAHGPIPVQPTSRQFQRLASHWCAKCQGHFQLR